MKPIYQTKTGEGKGNCFQAAVASILELELEQVPDFCNIYKDGDEHFFREFNKWLRQFGLAAVTIYSEDTVKSSLREYMFKDCYLLVCVKNKDGVLHSVVYKNGKMVHDPNFWNEGKYIPQQIDLIFTINPSQTKKKNIPKLYFNPT